MDSGISEVDAGGSSVDDEQFCIRPTCPVINIAVVPDGSSPPSTPPAQPTHTTTNDQMSKGDCLILIDWDDTLCTSTLMASMGFRIDEHSPLPETLLTEIADLEVAVIAMLEEANRLGTVIIVTNAETGWVEMSGERFVPDIADALKRLRIQVISARSTYEHICGSNPSDWKIACFVAQMELAYQKLGHQVDLLSIGDSLHERVAAHNAGMRAEAGTVKTVKLMERPDVNMLRRQISLLAENMENICLHPDSVDVNLVPDTVDALDTA